MTLLLVFVGLVVGWVALRGLLAHARLSVWVRTSVFWSVPLGSLTWAVIMVADEPMLFPDTAPCPRVPYGEGVIGDGEVTGVSTAFPPRAYCLWEDGTVHELAPGAEFLFWVFFAVTVLSLGAGLWHAVRNPQALLR
ncbi:hypothetical protein [Streptomyces sp. bgisy022]|uniref:hypothetical protein n=1 Tax=Streptomyces sp. bgisy022 TaxID=3413769 RepID=UPI003D71877F